MLNERIGILRGVDFFKAFIFKLDTCALGQQATLLLQVQHLYQGSKFLLFSFAFFVVYVLPF